jgi:hypothetical protein
VVDWPLDREDAEDLLRVLAAEDAGAR